MRQSTDRKDDRQQSGKPHCEPIDVDRSVEGQSRPPALFCRAFSGERAERRTVARFQGSSPLHVSILLRLLSKGIRAHV